MVWPLCHFVLTMKTMKSKLFINIPLQIDMEHLLFLSVITYVFPFWHCVKTPQCSRTENCQNVCFYRGLYISWWSVHKGLISSTWLQLNFLKPVEALWEYLVLPTLFFFSLSYFLFNLLIVWGCISLILRLISSKWVLSRFYNV